MARMLDLGDIHELVNDGFNNPAQLGDELDVEQFP